MYQRPMTFKTFLTIIGTVLLMSGIYLGATAAIIPYDIGDAESTALGHTHGRTVTVCGETIDLGITEQDYRQSMRTATIRVGTAFAQCPTLLVTPDSPPVRRIADTIQAHTQGMSDRVRVNTTLHTVQDIITYAYDTDLYGQDDFWSFPLETLYLGRGDCEDTSILLISILTALGYDCVFLDFPGHIAVGVCLDDPSPYIVKDGRGYSFCETTAQRSDAGDCLGNTADTLERVVGIDHTGILNRWLGSFTAWGDHALTRLL